MTSDLPDPLDEQRAGDVRVVARGGATQIAGQITQRALTFVFYSILTRGSSVAAFGLYRQVASTLGLASHIALGGFNFATVRFIARARARGDLGGVRGTVRVCVWGATIVSLVAVGIIVGMADQIARIFGGEGEPTAAFADLLLVGVVFVPLYAMMQVFRYATQAYKTMTPSVISGNVVQPAILTLVGGGAVALGYGVRGATVALVVSTAAGCATAIWFYRRILSSTERLATPHADIGEILRFAFPQAGSSLLSFQSLGYGVLIVGALGSNLDAGLFSIALALQGPGTLFLGGIVNVWAPVVADLYERDEIERLGALYQTITRWVATFSFPVWAVLILRPELFASIFSPQRAHQAASAVAILAAGNIFFTGTGPSGYVVSMTGHPTFNLINSVVSLVAYIGLGIAVVPSHGVVGIAVVDAVVTALSNISRVLAAWHYVGIQPFGKSFYKPVVATLAGAAILLAWGLFPGSLVVQGAGIAVAGIVYLVVLRTLGVDPEEREVLNRIRKRLPGRRS